MFELRASSMSWEHAQRVRRAMDKKEHPDKYCPDKKCLRLRGVCRKHTGGRDLQGKAIDHMVVDDVTTD